MSAIEATRDAFIRTEEVNSSAAEVVGPRTVWAKVVSSSDERRMVIAVRSSVFLGEEQGAYADHFDENDECAAHLLVFVGREPVGTLRCRSYAGFARIEKLAIRKGHRSYRVLNALVRVALRFCWSKGYRMLSGISRPEVVAFWCRKGGFEVGPPVQTQYGPLVPLYGPLPDFPDIEPVTPKLVGTEIGERRLYAWEGAGL